MCCSIQQMQAPVGAAEGASTLAKLQECGSENPRTQRHNNSRTRASRHFPDRGKPTPSYASCLALSSREGRNKVTQPTSVRRLVLMSLVRQPLVRWSSITVFIVFSFVNTCVPVQSDPHLEAPKEQTFSFSGHASNRTARSCCRCSPTLSPIPFCRFSFRVRVDPLSWSSVPKLSLQLLL